MISLFLLKRRLPAGKWSWIFPGMNAVIPVVVRVLVREPILYHVQPVEVTVRFR
jgi:hypothetical protein